MRFFFTILRTFLSAFLISTLAVGQTAAQSNGKKMDGSVRDLSITDLKDSESTSPSTPSNNKGGLQNSEYPTIKVHVLGDVENPGIFNVNITDRLSNVLILAGSKRPSRRLVQLRSPGEKTRVFDLYRYYFQGDLSHNPFLKDNDTIFVPAHHGIIRIEGPVARPGLYELANEKTAADIVKLAGGFTSAASNIHPIKVIRFSEAGKRFVMNVNNSSQNLRSFKVLKGDIIVVSDIVNNPKDFDYTVESIPGENLFYPTSSPAVFVMGSVNQAGSYPYKSHLRVKDYIAYASPNPQARMGSVTLIRNGKRQRLKFDERPHPGDLLVVKTKIGIGAVVATVSTALTLTLTTLLLKDQLQKQ